eukprot:TRINITY_DN10977_c0_g1_i9.p3 TRINITY_DN10977_c0_g1~~TRINITY_DN10977_c0_g1_i9.p3  ORF type:complete len:105 (+),score=25.29 TRINITY_DN10977_c0_g1_i9:252-566(+)
MFLIKLYCLFLICNMVVIGVVFVFFFFFFKQKTAYEMLRSLVGSEMCIRDRSRSHRLCSTLSCDGVFSRCRPAHRSIRAQSQWTAMVLTAVPVLCVDTLSLIHI